jgi:hypothetical protein
VPENPKLIFCVIWETSVFVGQVLALQEGLDDHGIIDQFLSGKRFLSSSYHPDNLQGDPNPATHSVYAQGKAAGSGSKPSFSV